MAKRRKMTEKRFLMLRDRVLRGGYVSQSEYRDMVKYDPSIARIFAKYAKGSKGKNKKQNLTAAERERRRQQAIKNFGLRKKRVGRPLTAEDFGEWGAGPARTDTQRRASDLVKQLFGVKPWFPK